jgi:hypothetical protein
VSRLEASAIVPGRVSDAETLWYDTARWATFVDGFAAIVQRDPEWPAAGTLIWDSTPHGRGRVLERVSHHEQRAGQTAEVEDERLEGIQRIAFRADGENTRVTLSLDYELKERNLLTPVVDFLFVRRAVGDALRRTVARFAQERRGDAELT